jgi:hypothetical protein
VPPNQLRLPPNSHNYTGHAVWTNRWGQTTDYYADANATPARVHLILAADDIWNSEPAYLWDAPEIDRRPVTTITCCGQTRDVRGWPCPTCREPDCPVCGKCGCDRAAEQETMCTKCFQKKMPHLLTSGVCVDCQ